MKRRIGIVAAAVILSLSLFSAGVLAHATYLSFTGDERIENTSNNIDEIMLILRQVNEDKLTAEEALAELEALNPPGLVKKIKQLEEEIEELDNYVKHLETELVRANNKVEGLDNHSTEAVEEAREYLNN